MGRKMKWGIRKKAAALLIVLILIPSLFIISVDYSLKESVSGETRLRTEELLVEQMLSSATALNRNASLCMDNYLSSIELVAGSAAEEIPNCMGRRYHGKELVWASKYLLTQVNHSMVGEIINGSLQNEHYDAMVSLVGKETVDSALLYLVDTPELNYSDPHINSSAYAAISALGKALFDRESMELYDFLYSVLLPGPREELERLFPVADTLYSFRDMPDLLWSYYADEESGFIVLIPPETYFSPLFNAQVRPWYSGAEKGHPWSEVYVDEITGSPVATYSLSVRINGSFSGVVGFDLLLSTLTERTREFYVSDTSFAFVICGDGRALAYPDEKMLGKDLSEGETAFNMSIRDILGGEEGVVHSVIEGRNVTLVYSTMDSTGWKFVNVLDMEEMEDKAKYVAGCAGHEVSEAMALLILIDLAVGVVVFAVAFAVIGRHIRRIERLTGYANEVSMGNLDVEGVEPGAEDEMGDLERSFKRMLNSLKVALRELERGGK